jgi:pimeloyl-ACP methyl ester carboxylesterase
MTAQKKSKGRPGKTAPDGPKDEQAIRAAPGYLACPQCQKEVKVANLEPHLRRVHDMTVPQAKAVADELLTDPDTDPGGKGFVLAIIAAIMILVLVMIGSYLYLMQNTDQSSPETQNTEYLPIAFTTEDGYDLHGDFYTGSADKPYLVLVHGMNEDRKAYRTLARELHAKGYGIVSYDSRGFGQSKVRNGVIVEVISQQDIQKGGLDIKAALGALESRGLTSKGVILVGASVGANIAAVYAVNDTRVIDIVLLSPGDDYQGVEPLSAISKYSGGILFVAFKGDDLAYQSCNMFYSNATKAKVKNFFYKDGLYHGTGDLVASDLRSKIVAWIEEND